MKKESIMFGAFGLLAGVIIAGFVAGQAVNNNNNGIMRVMGISASKYATKDNEAEYMDMSMELMNSTLKGKTGDDFDKTFINEMIGHHQGAIGMAVLAKQNAKHDEVKKLADDIIAAQSKEITQMKSWQQQWGYGTIQSDSHSVMNMSH